MSEPEFPRWLNEVGDELRQEVPVRAAWRARLLDDIARSPRPTSGDDGDVATALALPQRRRITLSPLTGIAAALLCALLGAGAAVATLSWRDQGGGGSTLANAPSTSGAVGSPATLAATGAPAEQDIPKVVRFELAAPRAAHVALVGSFNEWNPTATPLRRDPSTGKWIVSLRLPPGRHVYTFVVDGDVTADPAAPRAADADFGSANSVLLVAGRSS